MVCRKLAQATALVTLMGWGWDVYAQALPEADGEPHEGVASCSTSVCHGKVSPDPEATVKLNEYRVWLREDYHSRAYRTLQSAQSKTMAKKLKITWTKSTISTRKEHRGTVRALGLRRLNHSVIKEDSPQLRGMIRAVDFLISVEEVQ